MTDIPKALEQARELVERKQRLAKGEFVPFFDSTSVTLAEALLALQGDHEIAFKVREALGVLQSCSMDGVLERIKYLRDTEKAYERLV